MAIRIVVGNALGMVGKVDMKKYSFIKPDPKLRANLMAFGYECDSGWIPLIEGLFDKITEILKENIDLTFEVVQVKEKFGTLSVYFVGGNDAIYDLVDEYEHASSLICEICGNTGFLRENRRWYKTLCGLHYEMWIDGDI